MDSYRELVISSKVILEVGNYGFWKARMKATIKGIDPLAWKAVESGWKSPVARAEDGTDVPKLEELWTDDENKMAKFNARALTVIHCSVARKQFELIQGCEAAKDAWDILQKHFEGTSKVQSSRKDMLATRFEELKMEENESKYKEKKLVKKFLRCLPSKFMAYKAAMTVSCNTDEMTFDEVVGMLQAHEMEVAGVSGGMKEKGIALASVENEHMDDNDPVSLLVRRFDRALRKVENGQKKFGQGRKTSEPEKNYRKNDAKCYECKGYGHFRTECPTVKRREIQCHNCKGYGHTQAECESDGRRKPEKSMIGINDSESDSESEEEVNNFVAFLGIVECESGSESDVEQENDLDESYKEVRETLVKLGTENLALAKEKARLEVEVQVLKDDLDREAELAKESVNLIKEKLVLSKQADELREELLTERKKAADLQAELDQQYRKIKMLTGTKQLDKILSCGRTESSSMGLGYSGRQSSSTGTTRFVSGGFAHAEETKTQTTPAQMSGCFFCGKFGHYKRYCYKYLERVKQVWKQHKFWRIGKTSRGWMKKNDLYPKIVTEPRSTVRCNMARVASDPESEEPWYFDSGCSRHMTGNIEYLDKVSKVKGGKVTFGDGGCGVIQGKGTTCNSEVPKLVNVYFVKGLKANLISVSQLCDDGLTVCFSAIDCRAINQHGVTVLQGVRSGNNCYMWEKKVKCLSAQGNIDLWHRRLGHMNFRNLTNLVCNDLVRGVPKLKIDDKIVCGACNEGKQVKIQHKKVPDVQAKAPLDLVHMDLMGPMQTESIGGKKYVFVLVDDYTRFTWVRFLREKSEVSESFKIWALQLINEKGGIKKIRSDHGGEFENDAMTTFLESRGIAHQFAAPWTPQQNGVVERKNRTLQEMGRAMLHGNKIAKRFWAEALSTACYTINRVYVRKGTTKTPYEMWTGKTPNLSYFHVFGCKCYILNDKDYLGKFDSRSDEGFFLDEEEEGGTSVAATKVIEEGPTTETIPQPVIQQVHRNHSKSDVIGGIEEGRKTRGK
ncbi:uncharacterized protein LOC108838558, partial [Raphanus sativus]|uniref:Uncharacterized protein LOC108838558 n=1 Tax=Raphanus sativus TaxID=3726 RepID=A0A9W3CVA9_RAPSA